MKADRSLVFVTYVFGSYHRYIPYYVFGLQQSYPQHPIIIHTAEQVSNDVIKAVDLIGHQSVTIKEEFLSDLDFKQKYISGGNQKINRWLIPYEELKDYQYAYIGDVDMFIVPEMPTLKDAHVEHMERIKLPYSNAIRPHPRVNRLTGLHFIDVQPYYDKMEPVIQKHLGSSFQLNNTLSRCRNNEEFLYFTVEQGIGFGPYKDQIVEGQSKAYRPHHGLHIGLLRINRSHLIEVLPAYMNNPKIEEIQELVPLKELR